MIEQLILHPRGNEILKQYGYNSSGQPLFRLVWSESRFRFLVGEFRPLYNCREWILEEWRPSENYGSPESWKNYLTDEGQSRLGPYPFNGDYEELYRMGEIREPNETQLQFIAKVARESANQTPEQKLLSWKADEERKRKELESSVGDLIHDSWPTQRELDHYYANDFRFQKQAEIAKKRMRFVQGEQILVIQPELITYRR